jgi:transposase-like protein
MTNLIKNLQDFTCTDCGENYQSLYAYINDNSKVSCFHCIQENQ